MPHHTSLIATIVAGLGLAFLLGILAHRVKLSPLVGYLLAGVLLGPFTPGYVADQALAPQLAEIGVILLMFGFGLALSVASTVVLLRALQERRLVETERGRIAVGWLIVEDLAMVLTLVLLPVVAGLIKGDNAGAGIGMILLPVA